MGKLGIISWVLQTDIFKNPLDKIGGMTYPPNLYANGILSIPKINEGQVAVLIDLNLSLFPRPFPHSKLLEGRGFYSQIPKAGTWLGAGNRSTLEE